jgi:Leucine-rich repeat (LRR) protein
MCILCDKYMYVTHVKTCANIRVIPYIQELKSLDCQGSAITEIPSLPNLRVLNCSNTQLTSLPELPSLSTLNCSQTLISKIRVYNNLTSLNCESTPITSIPDMPNLIEIYAINCRMLTNAPNRTFSTGSIWIRPNRDRMDKLYLLQRCFKRRCEIKKIKIRLQLIRHLPLVLVNMIDGY